MVFGNRRGDGRSTLFENWDAVKLEKYDINPDEYDHTNMASRPSILIDNYHTHKTPYLTMIFLWDEKVDFFYPRSMTPWMKVQTRLEFFKMKMEV